ncbi:hypothetical protein BELL_1684g00010 [Botrytis elliptica]|uniref:RING-type domain-containing protein n=1 Tax=Botrytis elliptica TaxID=278938 RepID=A0A4Z1HSK8_9HELO|nr:hypothetical protein EAE99_012115 [Botrytis elliptica]TGO52089.1 hypothetical protein BELL_1684g00010 [Botrytis elliptica]
MDIAQELCVIDETFHTVCGHVITRIKHEHENCRNFDRNPYLEGQYIDCQCRAYHINQATVLDSSCKICLNTETDTIINEWRSDEEAITPAEIESRREFWARYTEEQRTLFTRQEVFERDAETGREAYEVGVQLHNEGADELTEEILDRLALNSIRLNRTRGWYVAQQTYHFGQIRRGIPDDELEHLYDETDPNPAILAPVLPADVPDDEICGICRQSVHVPGVSGLTGLLRVFCGLHIFHHDCILPWFRQGNPDTVSCPACRASRNVIIPPDFSDIVLL